MSDLITDVLVVGGGGAAARAAGTAQPSGCRGSGFQRLSRADRKPRITLPSILRSERMLPGNGA